MRKVHFRYFLLALLTLFLYTQPTIAQEALSSVHINIQNIKLSGDQKTISYDVYFQSVNTDTIVALAAYLFRLSAPISEMGANAKTISVTKAAAAIGSRGATITETPTSNPTHWLMKFQNSVLVSSYESAPQLSRIFPGTFLATVNVSNTDGSTFANPQSFTPTYAGNLPLVKTTISIFKPNTTTLSANANTAQPSNNFTGLEVYSLKANKIQLSVSDPVVTFKKKYDGSTAAAISLGSLQGVDATDVSNVTLNATAVYDNAKVGVGKTITVNYDLSGTASGNYAAPASRTYTTGEITVAPITISGVTAKDKVYDGTVTATLIGGSLVGVVAGDDVSLVSGTGVFADATIGNNKAVTASGFSISGKDAFNYTLNSQPSGLTASITSNTSALTVTSDDPANVCLYPNPTRDYFHLHLADNKTAMLTIFDMRCCKVLSQVITGSAEVNISSLLNGIYIIDVDGVRKKLIKY